MRPLHEGVGNQVRMTGGNTREKKGKTKLSNIKKHKKAQEVGATVVQGDGGHSKRRKKRRT